MVLNGTLLNGKARDGESHCDPFGLFCLLVGVGLLCMSVFLSVDFG